MENAWSLGFAEEQAGVVVETEARLVPKLDLGLARHLPLAGSEEIFWSLDSAVALVEGEVEME